MVRARRGEAVRTLESAVASSTDECILWPHARTPKGYGLIKTDGANAEAHRRVCIAAHGGPPPSRPYAAHSCGNSSCVNPRHLRWATAAENLADMVGHGTAQRGEKHPKHKLTAIQVAEIIELRAAGGKLRKIGLQYGVSESTVCRIVTGSRWRYGD